MSRTFNFIATFAKAALIAFILLGSVLSAIMVPLIGLQSGTLAFVGAVSAILAVIIGVQEASGYRGETYVAPRAPKLYTPLGAVAMSFLGSAVATFVMNMAFWSLYWGATEEDAVASIALNAGTITLFSLLVGLFAAAVRAVTIAVKRA